MPDSTSSRLIIRGGTVIDGSGARGFAADLLIEDGLIGAIWRGGSPAEIDAEVLDAGGRVVAPGFVDLHAHADVTLLAFPTAESATRQGVTTVVNGNCGLGPAPLRRGRDFRRVTAAYEASWEVPVDWDSFGAYLDRLDGAAINAAMLVPHGAVRNAVMGLDRRPPSAAELAEMVALVEEGMRAGAVGISTGLEYQPGCFAEVDELVAVVAAAARHGGVYATHIRNRGDRFAAAAREAVDVAERAGARLQLSHFAPRPYAPERETEQAFAAVDALAGRGHPVGVDTFPEIWGPGLLLHLLPDEIQRGEPAEMLERLARPDERAGVREHFAAATNFLVRAGGYERIVITSSPADPSLSGRSVAELAAAAGTDPGTWTCDALLGAGLDLAGLAIRHIYATESDLRALMARPDCSLGSDGVVTCCEGADCPYPWNASSYGYAARTLGHYVRDEGFFTLEEAVRRLSALPAESVGLTDRGRLAPGLAADVVVFDAERIDDRTTPDDIARHPVGIDHVLVGGRPVVADGRPVDERPGRTVTLARAVA